MPKNVFKCTCANCGAVNLTELPEVIESENWLPCILPTGFEWFLPSGKITPVVGEAIYVDAFGAHISKAEYIAKYNLDPEIAYTKMRGKDCKIEVPEGTARIGHVGHETVKKEVKHLGKY